MIIKLEGEFTDLNTYINKERSNRFMAANIKKEETERVIWQCKQLNPIEGDLSVHFHWIVPNARKDPDNIAFAKKFILDGLVSASVIPNDTQKTIKEFRDTFEVGEPMVIITITNV